MSNYIDRIYSIRFSSYGHYKVTITYRGKRYDHVTTNTIAIDRYNDDLAPAKARRDGWLTRRQAALSLYNEVKRRWQLR